MKRLIALLLLCAVFSTDAYSQGCTPDPNPQPGPDCTSAPFLCCGEVDGLSGTLPMGVNQNGPNPLCPGTSTVANNIEWVSFAAGSTSLSIDLTMSNCTPGGTGNGVQVGIYSGCDFNTNVYCNGGQNTGLVPINLNNLVIGEVYHIFIDGFSGAVCDYLFDVTSGSTVSPEPFDPPNITGTTSLCEGAIGETYFAGLGMFSSFNQWTVSDPSVIFNDNGTSITVTDWGTAAGGTVDICAEGLNDCFMNPDGLGPCITVQVNQNQTLLESGQYCENEPGYVYPGNMITYPEGTHFFNLPDPASGLGCEIEVELEVSLFVPDMYTQETLLCPGEVEIIEGTPYFPPFSGVIPLNTPDANGCFPSLSLDLQVIDTSVNIIASTLILDCAASQALLTANINFDPEITYTFVWDSPDTGVFIGGTNQQTAIVSTPGTYTLNITMEGSDDNGIVICQSTPTQVVITQDMGGPDLSAISQTPASCGTELNGTATVNPMGGATPYDYLWDDPNAQETATATGLADGTYQVTVTDNTGCSSVAQIDVLATPVVTLDAPVTTDVSCFGELTGEATVSTSGGTGTIDITSDFGGITGPTATGLPAGTYEVIATDQAGCADTTMVTINQPVDAVAVVVDSETNTACGQTTGGVSITPSGGTAPYTYMWSDLSTDQDLTGVGAGVYQVTVIDFLGCETVTQGTVDNADGPAIVSIDATDVSCMGLSDGSINLEYSGGIMPYTVVWDNAPDVEDPSGLLAGAYNVIITDGNGCFVTGATSIGQPELLEVVVNSTDTECNGATGDLFTTVTGGSTVDTYMWDNGAGSTANPQDLPAGTYNLTVTDVNGCEAFGQGIIVEPDAPIGTAMATDASCFGADDGSITISMTSTGTFDYDWGSASLNNAPTNGGLEPNTYTIIVTDQNNCSTSFTETIGEPSQIMASISTEATLCFGQNNGSATVTPSGGSGTGYTYQWCNGEDTQTATSLLSGPCTVVVMDDTGCSESFDLTISDAQLLEADLIAVTDLPCFEDGMGAIDIDVIGGTGSYTYNWSDASISNTTQDPTSLDAGIYTVEVVDDEGCMTQVTNITVTQPQPLDIDALTDDASCNLPNGTIDVTVNGGTGNIDYTFSPTLPGNTGQHIQTVSSGIYQLEVQDENGCVANQQIEVEEPNALTVDSEVGSLLGCFGDVDGTASVVVSGGSMPYEYDWGTASAANSPDIGGLAEGTYNVIITDYDGCIVNASMDVDQPAQVAITLAGSVDPDCAAPTGSIDISVSGGTAATDYTYNWNNGEFSTQDISNLGSGTYIVLVTDDNDCVAQETFGIQAPDSFTPSEVSTDVTCNGLDNGVINISIPDGSGNFDYQWSDASIPNGPNATGLSPDFYTATIMDNITGCINEVTVEIIEPPALNLSGTPTDPSCLNNDGEISAVVNGGTGTPGLTWSGPNSFTSNAADIANLEAGDYTLNVLDDNGCPGSLLVTIELPDSPTLMATPQPTVCFGESTGSILAAGSTPNGNFTYEWSLASIGNVAQASNLPPGSYNVTITDDENCIAIVDNIIVDTPPLVTLSGTSTQSDCDVDNGTMSLTPGGGVGGYTYEWDPMLPPTQNQAAVGPGNYNVTVYDSNLCPATTLVTVDQPNPAALSEAITNVTCFQGNDGSIDLTVTGTGTYTYTWDNTTQNVPNPSGLSAGSYSVTVADQDGCETFGTYNLTEGAEVTATGFGSPDLCGGTPDGSIALTVTPGTGTYTFDWDDPTVPDVQNPTGLTNGVYVVTIYDANGCPFVESFALNDPAATQFDGGQVDVLCFGELTGQASIDITSGAAPYTVTWTDDMSNVISTNTLNTVGSDAITSLAAGTYFVEIVDANGCPSANSFNITEPMNLAATALANQSVSCFGFDNGIAIAQPTGGIAPYFYEWDDPNSSTTQEVTGLPGDQTYNVTVTDFNGCTEIANIEITEPELLEVDQTSVLLDCNGDTDAEINLLVIGGTSGYTFDWDQNQFDGQQQLTGLDAGDYTVTVSDLMNCTDELTITIPEPAGVDLQVASVSDFESFNVSCFGFTDGFIQTSATGGTGTLDYQWDDANNSTTPDLMNVGAGTYNLIVTDQNGCMMSLQETLIAPSEIMVEFEEVDVRCFGETNGALIITNASGGAGDYMFSLDGALTGAMVFNGLAEGQYTLTGEDSNGCPTTQTINIEEPNELTVGLGSDIDLEYGDCTTIVPSIQLGGATLSILEWDNEDELCPLGNCATINVKPENTTTYRITVIDENGCVSEDEIIVRVRKNRDIYIPNAFNPNSSVGNELFQIKPGRAVVEIQDFIVVDRWGEIMYRIPEAFDPHTGSQSWGWDGKLGGKDMNPGVYVYYAKVKYLDGEVIDYAGDITLVK